MLKSETLIIE